MRDFLSFGKDIIHVFLDLKNYLFAPFTVPLVGDVTIFGLLLGGGLFGLLTYKIIKFYTDIIL